MNAEVMEAPEMHHHIDRIATTPSKDVIIGANIRRIRKARGHDIRTFGTKIMGYSHHSEEGLVEAGNVRLSTNHVARYAEKLKCKPEDLDPSLKPASASN